MVAVNLDEKNKVAYIELEENARVQTTDTILESTDTIINVKYDREGKVIAVEIRY